MYPLIVVAAAFFSVEVSLDYESLPLTSFEELSNN